LIFRLIFVVAVMIDVHENGQEWLLQ
jgi:hypothetical protein